MVRESTGSRRRRHRLVLNSLSTRLTSSAIVGRDKLVVNRSGRSFGPSGAAAAISTILPGEIFRIAPRGCRIGDFCRNPRTVSQRLFEFNPQLRTSYSTEIQILQILTAMTKSVRNDDSFVAPFVDFRFNPVQSAEIVRLHANSFCRFVNPPPLSNSIVRATLRGVFVGCITATIGGSVVCTSCPIIT